MGHMSDSKPDTVSVLLYHMRSQPMHQATCTDMCSTGTSISPVGYCQITCGRCPCCKDLAAVAEGAGLTEFLWAMNRTTDRVEALSQPGYAVTLLAPDNSAMQNLFDKLGELACWIAGLLLWKQQKCCAVPILNPPHSVFRLALAVCSGWPWQGTHAVWAQGTLQLACRQFAAVLLGDWHAILMLSAASATLCFRNATPASPAALTVQCCGTQHSAVVLNSQG